MPSIERWDRVSRGLDEGLPLNRGILSGLDFRWVPIPDQLNRYELRVINLPAGKYAFARGRPLVRSRRNNCRKELTSPR